MEKETLKGANHRAGQLGATGPPRPMHIYHKLSFVGARNDSTGTLYCNGLKLHNYRNTINLSSCSSSSYGVTNRPSKVS
jgi:hypothetical protein